MAGEVYGSSGSVRISSLRGVADSSLHQSLQEQHSFQVPAWCVAVLLCVAALCVPVSPVGSQLLLSAGFIKHCILLDHSFPPLLDPSRNTAVFCVTTSLLCWVLCLVTMKNEAHKQGRGEQSKGCLLKEVEKALQQPGGPVLQLPVLEGYLPRPAAQERLAQTFMFSKGG